MTESIAPLIEYKYNFAQFKFDRSNVTATTEQTCSCSASLTISVDRDIAHIPIIFFIAAINVLLWNNIVAGSIRSLGHFTCAGLLMPLESCGHS